VYNAGTISAGLSAFIGILVIIIVVIILIAAAVAVRRRKRGQITITDQHSQTIPMPPLQQTYTRF